MGTLRCVLGIVKMQALVRARRSCISVEGSSVEDKVVEKLGKYNQHSNLLVRLLSSQLNLANSPAACMGYTILFYLVTIPYCLYVVILY